MLPLPGTIPAKHLAELYKLQLIPRNALKDSIFTAPPIKLGDLMERFKADTFAF